MSLYNEQIRENGKSRLPNKKSMKWAKKQTIRKHRRKIKSSLEYTPQYNRYKGWYD